MIPSSTSAAYIKPTTDPTEIGIGARPVGMGKAYVGLADDINALFLNPSGLANVKSWQLMSMTTRLINVIDYISLAGTYCTDVGTFGLGYVGANIGGSFITGITLIEGHPGIVFPVATEEEISYSSSVILVGYGSEFKRFFDFGIFNDMSFGATFKLFSQGLSGGGITDGTLSGYDMDFGFQYKPSPWYSIGLTFFDALSESMGGKLVDATGERIHTLPMITTLGFAFKVLGDNALYPYPQPLVYLLDFDYVSETANYPLIARTGLEWWPSNYLALRLGFDQDIVGKETGSSGFNVETNMAAGVGVYYSGFKFDYAYRRYGLSENDTSYVSLSYAAPIEIPSAPKKKEYLKIFSPEDKLITYDQASIIKGQVFNLEEISKLLINGNDISFSPSGTFEASYPLLLGKNKFNIEVMSKDNVLASSEVRILRLVSFKDVTSTFWAKEPIEYLATLKIVGGYPDGTFKPNKAISRAELTTLLVKAKGVSSTEGLSTTFSDVLKKHWASFFIKNGVDLKWVTGYPDKTFKPGKSLNRAEAVTILTRFADLPMPETLVAGPFPDVPGRHWAAKAISAARSAGLLNYLLEKPFDPNKALTRAEAAEMLSNTQFATDKINDLTSFESY